MDKSRLYFCRAKHEKAKFSLKVGTVMEDSPIALEKWLPAFWLLTNCKNGISSYELGRALGITQKAAWHVLGRIRKAMEESDAPMMGGQGKVVQTDETFLGGDPKNFHESRRKTMKKESRDKWTRMKSPGVCMVDSLAGTSFTGSLHSYFIVTVYSRVELTRF